MFCDHREPHILTHSFPRRRSSDLSPSRACASGSRVLSLRFPSAVPSSSSDYFARAASQDRTEGPDNEHHQIAYADLGKHGRLRGGGKAADENTPDTAIETLGNRTVGQIGRASCREECVSTCRYRWSTYP